jgi:DNA mismatch repair ATPase MutS
MNQGSTAATVYDIPPSSRKNTTTGVGYTLTKMQDIESFLNKKSIQEINKEDLVALGSDLRKVRQKIESLANMDVLTNETKEKQWIDDANDDLADRLKQESILNMSLTSIFQELLITWDQIIRKLIDRTNYSWNNNKEWWENINENIRRLLDIILIRERLMYVGIGIIILSAFVFFVFVTE